MTNRRQSGNFQFQEDTCSENVEEIRKVYHEASLLMQFLQTKPQSISTNFFYYDLFYTVCKKETKKNCKWKWT